MGDRLNNTCSAHVLPLLLNEDRPGNFMKLRSSTIHALVVGLFALVLAACHCQASTQILFIGNSFTYINSGLDKQLEELSPATATARVVAGGYTLEKHWADGNALRKIRERKWDYVVLQEQSQAPIVDQKKFYEFARKFDSEIRSTGSKTILLMTWERPDSVKFGVTAKNLADAFTTLGKALGAKVAPAGMAFARSVLGKAALRLTTEDGHPTVEGTYLAACVLYGTIFQRSPVGNPYSPRGMPAATSSYLQRMAAESLGY
jgi:hypothetical protein